MALLMRLYYCSCDWKGDRVIFYEQQRSTNMKPYIKHQTAVSITANQSINKHGVSYNSINSFIDDTYMKAWGLMWFVTARIN